MRYTVWLISLFVVATAVVLLDENAEAADANRTSSEIELFTVDLSPVVASFNQSNIVSDPPIIEASFYQMDSSARVVCPSDAEAYFLIPENQDIDDQDINFSGYRIIGRKPRGKAIEGNIYLLRRHPEEPRDRVLAKFDFRVDAAPLVHPSREEFLRAKGRHFQRFWSEEMAGSAMFRHIAITSLKEVGESARSTGPKWRLSQRASVDGTIALMSGGRAVSENLQLDNQLALPERESKNLSLLSEVRGIEVRAIDWARFLKEEPTELDPLSKLIPHDQYAVYLPSFAALAEVVDRGGEVAKPAVQWFEPLSRKTDVMGFYQKQLALPLNTLTRSVGKALIGEVAVTGSDPYFRTGTDIAILMHSEQPELLHRTIVAQVSAQAALHRGVNREVKRIEHRVDQHAFTQWSTENRSLSSFVGRFNDHVVVSNSLHQMMRVLECLEKRFETMHELDEYRFFRQRYPRQSNSESALVVITDAAIRRWCGPTWRIGASRRTRARATIAEVTMQNADELVTETFSGQVQVHSAAGMPNVGQMTVTPEGVHSAKYGTLDFQTPIAEMEMQTATTEEVKLYNTWRTQYERRWQRAFDPIALQLSLNDDSIHADLSVIPLMLRSEYRQYTQLVGNVRLKPDAGDTHPEALGEFLIALDTNSNLMQMGRMIIANGATSIDLLAWIDGSASVYFDYDQEWMERYEKRSPWEMSPQDLARDVPVGFFIPSKDNLRMTAFIVAIRSALQRFAPNMFEWESVKYHNYEYVVGTVLDGNAVGQSEQMPRLYYVTSSKGLTLSANRGVIERAIDRHLVNKDPPAQNDRESDSKSKELAAPQVRMQVTGKGAEVMTRANYRSGLRRMNRIAWSNIPILNYLRQRYPERDPHAVYQKLFRQTILEPSGGRYVWDAQRGTYVSSLQGYHLEPKAGPAISPVLKSTDRVKTTILFEDDGLRATLDVQSPGNDNSDAGERRVDSDQRSIE